MTHECSKCEKSFDTKHGLYTHIGQMHPGLRQTTIECKQCGDSVDVVPAAVDRTEYCSKECYAKGMSERPPEETPNYQGGKAALECPECEDEFRVKQARAEEATYCSRGCMAKAYERELQGENSPAWTGGSEDYYGPNWDEQRRKALERDNYACQDCGITREEYEWIDVHHIVPLEKFVTKNGGDYKRANRLENLIVLCRGCHRKWENMAGLRPDTRE